MSSLARPLTAALIALGLVAVAGCSNHCETLADTLCDKTGADLDVCRAAAQPAEPGAPDPCDRIRAVTLSCESLRREAKKASREDVEACRADLDLIRELTKQQE